MARAIERPAESWTWIPLADRELPEGEQTTFVLAPLTQAERMVVFDDGHVTVNGKRRDRLYQQALELVKTKVVDVRNFLDEVGTPIRYPGQKASDADLAAFWDRVDDILVMHIGQEIINRSSLGRTKDDTVGN